MTTLDLNDRLLIFLHILKTGGTSLRWALCEKFAPRHVIECYRATGCSLERDIAPMPDARKRNIRLLTSHQGYGIHQLFPQNASYITLLRHPDRRLISEYYQLQSMGMVTVSLESFINELPAYEADNGLVRALSGNPKQRDITEEDLQAAKFNLEHNIFVFGLQENYRQSLALFARTLGWKSLSLVRRNRSSKSSRPDDLDSIQQQCLSEFNQYDHSLYEHGSMLFQRLLERYEITDEVVKEMVNDGPLVK